MTEWWPEDPDAARPPLGSKPIGGKTMYPKSAIWLMVAAFFAGIAIAAATVSLIIETPPDPCRHAFEMSEKARLIAVDSLSAATDGLSAARTDDATGLVDAAVRLQTAQDQLEQLKPEYDRATQACKGNGK